MWSPYIDFKLKKIKLFYILHSQLCIQKLDKHMYPTCLLFYIIQKKITFIKNSKIQTITQQTTTQCQEENQ